MVYAKAAKMILGFQKDQLGFNPSSPMANVTNPGLVRRGIHLCGAPSSPH